MTLDESECAAGVPGWDIELAMSLRLERAYEDMQDTLSENIHGERDDTPSGHAYCGCQTCDVRESLTVLVPLIAAGLADGVIVRTTPEHKEEDHG